MSVFTCEICGMVLEGSVFQNLYATTDGLKGMCSRCEKEIEPFKLLEENREDFKKER